MSFSFLGNLAGLLPGYLQGQRMANQDNWTDLMNYNKTQAGQIENAFAEATFPFALTNYANSTRRQAYDTTAASWDLLLKQMYMPYALYNTGMTSINAPQTWAQTWQMQQQAYNNAQQGQGLAGLNGSTPRGII